MAPGICFCMNVMTFSYYLFSHTQILPNISMLISAVAHEQER